MPSWNFLLLNLFQTPTPLEPPPPTFWEANRDTILVGIIMALLGLLLFKPLEGLLKRLSKRLERIYESLGFGFKKRYYYHLEDAHQWLKLIGIRKAGLDRPRLRNVYISLKMRAAVAEESRPLAGMKYLLVRGSNW